MERYCMIATLGISPQVVTVALDALLDAGIVPERVELLSTDYTEPDRSASVQIALLKQNIVGLYKDRLNIRHTSLPAGFNESSFPIVQEYYVPDPQKPKALLKDIVTKAHHDAFMELAFERVQARGETDAIRDNPRKEILRDAPPALIVLIAGGRKTMSAGAQEAMVMLGDPGRDLLYHVLVQPNWLEELNNGLEAEFWYRNSGGTWTNPNDSTVIGSDGIQINLIPIMYSAGRAGFEFGDVKIPGDQMLHWMRSYGAAPMTKLIIDLQKQSVSYAGQSMVLEPLVLAFYAALAQSGRRVDVETGAYGTKDAKKPGFFALAERNYGIMAPETIERETVLVKKFLQYLQNPTKDAFFVLADLLSTKGGKDELFDQDEEYNTPIETKDGSGDHDSKKKAPQGYGPYKKYTLSVFALKRLSQSIGGAASGTTSFSKPNHSCWVNCFAELWILSAGKLSAKNPPITTAKTKTECEKANYQKSVNAAIREDHIKEIHAAFNQVLDLTEKDRLSPWKADFNRKVHKKFFGTREQSPLLWFKVSVQGFTHRSRTRADSEGEPSGMYIDINPDDVVILDADGQELTLDLT